MIKLFKISPFILSVSLMAGGLMLPTEKADAAWSNEQDAKLFGNECKVSVYTDLTNYTSVANTVDAIAKTNGKCSGTIYYDMYIPDPLTPSAFIGDNARGAFTSQSPTKYFNINSVKSKRTTNVWVDLYKNSNYTGSYEQVKSSTITIQPQ